MKKSLFATLLLLCLSAPSAFATAFYLYIYQQGGYYSIALSTAFKKAIRARSSFTDTDGNTWNFGDPFPAPNTTKVSQTSYIYVGDDTSDLPASYEVTYKVSSYASLFRGLTTLTTLDLSSFTFENVDDVSKMFENCTGLTSVILPNMSRDNLQTMTDMLNNAGSSAGLTVYVKDPAVAYALNNGSGLNTSKVTVKVAPEKSQMDLLASALGVEALSEDEIAAESNVQGVLSDRAADTYLQLSADAENPSANYALSLSASSSVEAASPAFAATAGTDIARIWQLEAGTYAFKLANANLKAAGVTPYLAYTAGESGGFSLGEASAAEEFFFDDVTADNVVLRSVTTGDTLSLALAATTGALSAGNGKAALLDIVANPSISVEVKATSDGNLATGYFPFPVLNTSENLSAYVGVSEANSMLKLQKTDGIDAKSGVIFEATEAGTYVLEIDPDALGSSSTISGTTVKETDLSGRLIFTIGKSSKKAGFYTPSNSVTSLAANKAYYTSSQNAIGLQFGGETTGIDALVSTQDEASVYDLSGRRVAQPEKGVYVKNGRKVVMK